MSIVNYFNRLTQEVIFKLSCTGQVLDVFNQPGGAPDGFTKITSNATTAPISKGVLNKISFVPRILNEHVESSAMVHSTVTATNIVGQIFQASKDNISALMLTLESAQGVVIDDFESYVDNAELQAVWTTPGANPALLEQTIVYSGTKAMRLQTIADAEEWSRSSAPQDYTGYTGKFRAYFSNDFTQQQVAVYIEDSVGNSKSFVLTQDSAGVWCDCSVNEAAMIEDQVAITDIEDITTIGYRVVLKRPGSFVIIDDLSSAPPPGDLRIKLWDMGTTIPDDGVTSIDDGVQYEQIGAAQAASFILPLQGGKRIYHLERFFAGIDKDDPDNETLNIDHYYILQLEYIDTEVNVHGPDMALAVDFYTNGFCFDTPDEATPITRIGPYSNIMFGILSTQEVYFVSVGWRFNAEPNGNSSILVFLEDKNKTITDIVVDHEESPEQEFEFNAESRPMYLADGGKLEFYYNDDFSDSVRAISGEARFWYEPPVVNG